MAIGLNQTKLSDAKLIRYEVREFGTVFAINHGADGFSIIDIRVPDVPNSVKEFLEGNDEITIYPVANNVDKLGNYALATFQNIETVYLFKTSAIVQLTQNSFGGLDNLESIYVPTDLYDLYVEAYPTLTSKFKKLISEYTWTIPTSQTSTLTVENMQGYVGMLSQAQKNAIGRVIIPTSYNDYEFGSTDSLVDGTFPQLGTVEVQNGILYLENGYSISQTGYKLEVE